MRQNSLIYENWKLYRWTDKQLAKSADRVKDELALFLGEYPVFKELLGFLPKQKGKIVELKDHQKEALDSLAKLREEGNSIALSIFDSENIGKQFYEFILCSAG